MKAFYSPSPNELEIFMNRDEAQTICDGLLLIIIEDESLSQEAKAELKRVRENFCEALRNAEYKKDFQ